MAERRVIFDYDPAPDWSYLTQWDTPEKYAGNEVLEEGQLVPFARYIETWGNPDWYVWLDMQTQERCTACHEWRTVDSLGGIEFLRDGNWDTGTFTAPEQLSEPYQQELVREALENRE